MKKNLFNTILIHVARTWERIRLTQPYKEMPEDNIGSVGSIIIIAEDILKDAVIQKFIDTYDTYEGHFWVENTKEGFSDLYIESLAEEIIKTNYL